MPEISLTIDGILITVPEGTNVIDAARKAGISIPVFCYHPRMKSVGMCRMCLVAVGMPRVDRATGTFVLGEDGKPVIAMLPKLQTACTTLVSQGMAVETKTEEVLAAQRGVLEFLLTSHPLDCPVCDKGGECPLQNLTMDWGPSQSRFDYNDKLHLEKPVPLGDLIFLDRERCIICGRCVRFQSEIADDPVLGFDNRGRNRYIISKNDPPFDSKFSGNTTDICPVGALTSADFRFRARVWELRPVPSLCLHCSVGCNITLDMRHDTMLRVMPRENSAVNDIWICDKGRFGQRFVESQERLTIPLVRQGGRLVESTWDEALHIVSEKFAALTRTHGSDSLAGLASERLSNEDLYLFQRLFREVLGSYHLDHRLGTPGDLQNDDIGATLGVGSGTNLLTLGKGTTVLVIGADPEEEAPIYMQRLRGIALRGGDLMVANVRATKLDRSATHCLRYPPGSEHQVLRSILSAVYEEVNVQRLPSRTKQSDVRSALNMAVGTAVRASGLREDDIRSVAQTLVQAENCIIVYGGDAMSLGLPFTQDLGNLLLLLGKVGIAHSGLIALLPRGNSRGVLDMGVRHDLGPGYMPMYASAQAEKKGERLTGLSAAEMWGAAIEQRIRGMYIVGLDPIADYPSAHPALQQLDFLVVQDMFLTQTAQMAHVVLPVAAFAERDGTYTNAERRVQRARQARTAPGQCLPDWAIFQRIAQALIEKQGGGTQGGQSSSSETRKSKAKDRSVPNGETQQPSRSWDYVIVSDVAMEIAERVPGYQGITYTALARTGKPGGWGRPANDSFYYDGTSYDNTEGVGIQCPSPAEQPNASFTITFSNPGTMVSDKRYPFVLVIQRLLYDGDALLRDSLLKSHVPAPYVVLNTTDAKTMGIREGDQVEVFSIDGALELVARVSDGVLPGSVLVPEHVPGASLSVIQTGPRTRVMVNRR